MSRCLAGAGVDHVVLERGRVAERWRSERWESLTLLTPNWQTRLPGFRYSGADPDGYMSMPELIAFLERYAGSFGAPVETGVQVLRVDGSPDRFRIETTGGSWTARHVVIATGYSDVPAVPAAAAGLSRRVVQIVPTAYRRPGQLPPGGVLVVGASATGIQIAEEVHASGRPVTLAVGRHLRVPRRYRGRDILWWLDTMGILRDSAETVFDIRASRAQPSLQLVGRPDLRRLDIAALRQRGVRIVGRVVAAEGERVVCDDAAVATAVASDVKLAQLLRRIDEFIAARALQDAVAPPEPFEPTWPAAFDVGPQTLDLRAEGITAVVWATGFRREYPWLRLPVFDGSGEIRHRGGVTPVPGVYVLGMHFQRHRNSAFLDGVGEDARFLTREIVARRQSAGGHRSDRLGREMSWPAGLSI